MLASIVIDEIQNATESIGHEAPYAFALIQGQQNNYLGYAIALIKIQCHRRACRVQCVEEGKRTELE